LSTPHPTSPLPPDTQATTPRPADSANPHPGHTTAPNSADPAPHPTHIAAANSANPAQSHPTHTAGPDSVDTPNRHPTHLAASASADAHPAELEPVDVRPAGGGRPARRARDPQARRDALVAATIEVIAENGIGRTTHRAVAAAAGLPLGATTYYFPTLDALIAAGLQHAAVAQEADLQLWAERIRNASDLASALVALTVEYLADRKRARIEYELCVAAARDEALRPLAVAWQEGFYELLATRVSGDAARTISALLDGAMLQVLVTGAELDTTALTDAIRRLAIP
jgi:DNA-binding transcriptional regulator YbjK